jgi:homopolymeric O-antigen transport system permease protein
MAIAPRSERLHGMAVTNPAPHASRHVPVLVVRGGRGRLSVESLRENWEFREVFRSFVIRRIIVKYKQASVGIGWAVLQPVLAALIFAVFFGHLAKVPSDGVPYLLFALAGTVVWSFFSSAAGLAMESLVIDQGLLKKVYFPREILPLSAVVAGLLDLAAGTATLIVFAAFYGIGPAVSWIALPLPMIIVVMACAAFGLCASAINTYYRDARHAMPFILQLIMYLSPVLYPLSIVPDQWQVPYAFLNPLAGSIDGFREIVLHGGWPDGTITAASLASSIVYFVIAYAAFKAVERGFTDRV